jgi:hypothetical protein
VKRYIPIKQEAVWTSEPDCTFSRADVLTMTENETGYLGASAHGIVIILVTSELLQFQRKNRFETNDKCYIGAPKYYTGVHQIRF